MGAWHEGPFGNDDALDWFDTKISGEIRRTVRLAVERPNRGYEATALCAIRCALMLCAAGEVRLYAFRETFLLAKEFLTKLKANTAYLASWRDRDKTLRQVREELVRVRAMVRLNAIADETSNTFRVAERDKNGFPTRIVARRKRKTSRVVATSKARRARAL